MPCCPVRVYASSRCPVASASVVRTILDQAYLCGCLAQDYKPRGEKLTPRIRTRISSPDKFPLTVELGSGAMASSAEVARDEQRVPSVQGEGEELLEQETRQQPVQQEQEKEPTVKALLVMMNKLITSYEQRPQDVQK